MRRRLSILTIMTALGTLAASPALAGWGLAGG